MRWIWPGLAVLAVALSASINGVALAQTDDSAALTQHVSELYKAGKFGDAIPLAEKALEIARRQKGEDHLDTVASISWLAVLYLAQGRYAQAEPLFTRVLEARERGLGKEHPETLQSVNNLAGLYLAQGRYAQAEPLLKRALEAKERVLGKEHPDTLMSVHNLAVLYQDQGRYGEAEPLKLRALEARERVLGKEHLDTLRSVYGLAALYWAQGRYGEAEPLYKRVIEAGERVLGKEHPDTLQSVNGLAVLYWAQGRYGEAEPLFRWVLKARERALGKEHPDTLLSVYSLAALYWAQGRYSEAEPLYKRAIEAYERKLGKEHPDTLLSVKSLAALYRAQGRYAEAEPLYKRALDAYERKLGKEHPDTLLSVNRLAALYQDQGRYGEAELLLRRALDAQERVLGKEHPDTLASLNNLASLYRVQGRYGEAEPLCLRALKAQERVLGKEHPDTLTSVTSLAALYQNQGRYGEAELIFKHALDVRERMLGKEHPHTLLSVSNLAGLYFAQRDWVRAAQLWRRSTAAIAGHEQRSALDAGQAPAGKKMGEAERQSSQFRGLVKAVSHLAPEGGTPDAEASRETFLTAQWAAGSEAAQSLAQMAARGATGNPALAVLVRERQDGLAEWQKRDGLRNAWLGQAPAKRNAKAEAENLSRLRAIAARIAEIGKQLAAKFPDYAALASPAPLPVEDVQAQLGSDEALVLLLDTGEWKPAPEETFIWVVTKTGLRWVRSELGTEALAREAAALRCGLDRASWDGKGADKCGQLLNIPAGKAPGDGDPLPFDLARAHALYKALFGQIEDLIEGKQLLLVPSGPLTQLPFQVLVTAPPASGDYKSAAWLIRDRALTVLPAVSSLEALRRVARPSAATKPMIGFGNPLLYAGGRWVARCTTRKSCEAPAITGNGGKPVPEAAVYPAYSSGYEV